MHRKHSSRQREEPLPCGPVEVTELLLGATPSVLGTSPKSGIRSRTCGRFRQGIRPLLPSLPMDRSLHGAILNWVATALESKISSTMCSRFKPQRMHLLQFWLMDRLSHGAIHLKVVTSLTSKMNLQSFKGLSGLRKSEKLVLPWESCQVVDSTHGHVILGQKLCTADWSN